jgi:hypothetical protein
MQAYFTLCETYVTNLSLMIESRKSQRTGSTLAIKNNASTKSECTS